MIHRVVFRTQLDIYDTAFLQKQLTAKNCELFPQKSSIADVWLGSEYPLTTGTHTET